MMCRRRENISKVLMDIVYRFERFLLISDVGCIFLHRKSLKALVSC